MNRKKSNCSILRAPSQRLLRIVITTLAVLTSGVVAMAQDASETNFNLVMNPQFIECLRSNSLEEPRARATVIRGNLNDRMILELDGIKPELKFTVFSLERTNLLADGTRDPNFRGFGLVWFQTDVETRRHSDEGHTQIRTILLNRTFGFDSAVQLPPTNTFHLGLWFDNPADAAACGFDVTKPSPFNGKHKAGPLAMISVPDSNTGLGPLCTEPNSSTTPASCNP